MSARASKRKQGRRFFVVTGISGAGKSQALKIFEDFGFFCVDNLPLALVDNFTDLLRRFKTNKDVALGMDIRGGGFAKSVGPALKALRRRGWACRMIFLDADDREVVRRFSETRHRHPLGENVLRSVRRERRILSEVKGLADKVIDTGGLTLGELKERISAALEMRSTTEMSLSVVSFGYKYGLPLDADIVMDVRFLPNPYYQPRLRRRTGLDLPVQNYILRQAGAKRFLGRLERLITSLLPDYVREGKSYLTLAIGCTGGRHRSVFVARHVARRLGRLKYKVNEFHRDIGR
ncbi:MAG: RNase adapter RapZ [Elusimicrobiota bacterium]